MLWQILLLGGFFSLSLVACGDFGIGGGGDVGQPRSLNATYKSTTTEKTVVFTAEGDYKFYNNQSDVQSQKPLLDAEYTVTGSEILFKRADGTEFIQRGQLAEDDKSFTWEQHPGEVFQAQTQ